MKTTQSAGIGPDHQTVAGTFEFKSNGKAIALDFTDQQLSPHAGSALFWGWLRPHARPQSNNKLLPLEKALAFLHGLLCDARKLTHVAYLRRDPLVPELLGLTRVASQSVLTRLLHKDGEQEGVKSGYTKQGIKPCQHPLLAVLAEVRLVAQLWLRPGNTACGNNVNAFFLDLWDHLPRHLRLKGVRADSGFGLPELLALWEQLKRPDVVVAKLNQPMQKIIKGDLTWTATEVPGTEVAELEDQAQSWPHPRRLMLLRQRVSDAEARGGKRLLAVPGYRFQALVTSLPNATHPPLAVWRYYNGRADCENVIKELQAGFALPTLGLASFWASEAALSLACLTYNLIVLFERQLGWQHKVTLQNLRFGLFVTAGVLSHPAGKTTIKLAVPERERDWWRRRWEKISSPFPNCNAVENHPAFTSPSA
jgi:hypothetical protein